MDILEALDSEEAVSGRACKARKLLDAIPDDKPGKDRLAAMVEDNGIRSSSVSAVFSRLGTPIHKDSIQAHRRHDCPCYR